MVASRCWTCCCNDWICAFCSRIERRSSSSCSETVGSCLVSTALCFFFAVVVVFVVVVVVVFCAWEMYGVASTATEIRPASMGLAFNISPLHRKGVLELYLREHRSCVKPGSTQNLAIHAAITALTLSNGALRPVLHTLVSSSLGVS